MKLTDFEPYSKLFHSLNNSEILQAQECLKPEIRTYAKGETIIPEDAKADRIGIVLTGSADIVKIDYYGNKTIAARISIGELFAESFACSSVGAMPVSVIAANKSVCAIFSSVRLLVPCSNACTFHSTMIYNLLKIISDKNIKQNKKLDILSQRTTREKLLNYLSDTAKTSGKSNFSIPFNRQELADFLGVERSALSAVISTLRREGVLKADKNCFTIL